ncbi:MAG: ATP-grasp domain-containing protein [Gammaproteobacteria bacterium]
MFSKILIANRGEIACRIARSARRMGVSALAVYSHADRAARHVRECDDAVEIGAAAPAESYLCAEKIIAAARQHGAEAIHPGYGFLSENADFAEACARAGLVFIGPTAAAIRAMGDKRRAREIMARAGVPLPPGWHGRAQRASSLRAAAAEVGYPLLIKAAAGGGGVGMRVVARAAEFDAALAAVRREASAAFGASGVYLEKSLHRARHVEVQIFADRHGRVVHLFDRDCSLQRRRQKIIEEAPAPGIDDALRGEMASAAMDAARAIGYVGAGTVEFLLTAAPAKGAAKLNFYFIEMNTRLQVEHAVTEMITGCDLVEWQLRVAAGEALPCAQSDLRARGHAIEARICAENPANDFLPSSGEVAVYRPGAAADWRRLDSGIEAGDAVPPHYDPLLAKLIAHGGERESARLRLREALATLDIAGVATNLEFLHDALGLKEFIAAKPDTEMLERNRAALCAPPHAPSEMCLAIAALFALPPHAAPRAAHMNSNSAPDPDPFSPWATPIPWQLNLAAVAEVHFTHASGASAFRVQYHDGKSFGRIAGELAEIQLTRLPPADGRGSHLFHHAMRATPVSVDAIAERITVRIGARRITLSPPQSARAAAAIAEPRLTAPMPGVIAAISVRANQRVARGAPLLTLEAMKMEHIIRAPYAGKITRLHFRKGAQVREGELLLDLEAE